MSKITKDDFDKAKDIEENIDELSRIVNGFSSERVRSRIGIVVSYKSGNDWDIPEKAEEDDNRTLFFESELIEKTEKYFLNEIKKLIKQKEKELSEIVCCK